MFPLDQAILDALNGAVGGSADAFETALLFCGQLPLILVVAVMLSLWWTQAGGSADASPEWTIGERGREAIGRRISRQRCVALAAGVALAFIATRLLAFGFELERPLAQPGLLVPIDPDRWGYIRSSMTGFGAFPSDHAALFFAVGVGLFGWGRLTGLGGIAVATLFCMARIAVGFHYPSDMYVGAAIGALFAGVAIFVARRKPDGFDRLARLFDEYPALLYPLLFVVAIDFTQHFRVVFKGIFSLIFMLVE